MRKPDNEWGRVYTLTRSKMKREQIDFANLEWTYLKGDGDFRSDEVRKLRDEADIVVTNPPFSQFRDFFAWVIEEHKNISPRGKITGHRVLYGDE